MMIEALGSLTLHVEPCPEDETRYRWSVREREHIVRMALYSLPDAVAAQVQGYQAMVEANAICRDTQAFADLAVRPPA